GIARSKNPALLADLSAAHFEHAKKMQHAISLLPAVAAAQRSRQLDPTSAQALWNLSIALEYLGARDAARQSWDEYLRLDATSEWSNEARQRNASLAGKRDEEVWPAKSSELIRAAQAGDTGTIREIVARFPTRSLALLERKLLPAWGNAA